MKKTIISALLCAAVTLSACAQGPATPKSTLCHLVLEQGEGYVCPHPVLAVEPGEDAAFRIECEDGYTLSGADVAAEITPLTGGAYLLTLPQVRYSCAVAPTVEKSAVLFRYDANDGSSAAPVEIPVTPAHLRLNTATDLFARDGYTLTAWNTAPDGSGEDIGLGARCAPATGVLYARWRAWSPAEDFTYTIERDRAVITGYTGHDTAITVPAALGGYPVYGLAAGAFAGAACETVVLPAALDTIAPGAFAGCTLRELTLFDSIRVISDAAFAGCENLATLHVNAAEPPVYSGSYFATFADKYDRLLALRGEKKLILFSGSATRFGYDCAALDAAFPDYEVANMGVFAYTSARPQLDLILLGTAPGDVLVHSPEFDTAHNQFCTSTDLDEAFFKMAEADYGLVAALDLRRYTHVFDALQAYLTEKEGMTKRSYSLSPAQFDEDGAPVTTPSYNRYGDYVTYRPNAATAAPVYGDPIKYTVAAFPQESYIAPLNAEYRRFLAKGAAVYFTYAPRNALALSPESTPDARQALDEYLRQTLCVPVISPIEDSLWSGVYLYGTDNHLSTEGAALHTAQIIPCLRRQMEADGLLAPGR